MTDFKPCVVVNEDARITEVVIEDAAYVAVPVFEGVHHYMDKHVAMDDGRLVGFAVWQTKPLAALDAETPVTPADVGEEPVAWITPDGLAALLDGGACGAWPNNSDGSTVALYSATALERVVRERGEALKARDFYEQRSLENNMLAHKWMAAHDALHAKKPYKFPAPVDLPDALARAESAEAKLAEALNERDALAKKLDPGSDPALVSRIIMRSIENEVDAREAEAEITTIRARLETVEAETIERCAKVADAAGDDFDNASPEGNARNGHAHRIAHRIRNLEPRHD